MSKTYTHDELQQVLATHGLYLARQAGGQRANLYGANLEGANLEGANLEGADLYGANLYGANLRSANLYGANLRGANLRCANLYGANLRCANLYGANLRSANLEGIDLSAFQIVPECGAFEGFKKLRCGGIAHLRIPPEAGRVGGLTGRKCRAECAEVLAISFESGEPCFDETSEFVSRHDGSFVYRIGMTVRPEEWNDDPPEEWNDDPREECAPGIHFFLTLKEAEDY